MKRRNRFALITVLAILMLTLSACGQSYFKVDENTDKSMLISAQKAGKDSYFMSGSLTVEEGEEITASADLSKGRIRVEIFLESGEQSKDQMPQLEEEPALSANLQGTDSMSGTVNPGTYMVQATCLEKATGSIVIEVGPAE
ncbi:MAG: hypothetical protein IKI23_09960 [Lachnospiraceae bacterium]|jgi:hypothetical protein|nr:hypothetical protein [Lachnospiraceae bacterium]